jgi:hypothetical protein
MYQDFSRCSRVRRKVTGWPTELRQISRLRLLSLDESLARTGTADTKAHSLAERGRALRPLIPVGRVGDELDGH